MAKYLITLHGLGLHKGYLVYVRDFFVQKGYVVKCLDLLGFGQTTTHDRGDIGSFHDYAREVSMISQEIRKQDSKARIFVWGENVGGTVALMYALEYPKCPVGVVAVNPVLSMQLGISKLEQIKLEVAAQLNPNMRIELPFLLQDLTDDEKIAEAIAKDEYVTTSITGRFWFALSKACIFLWSDASKMHVPFFIQYSTDSQMISEKAIDHFFLSAPVSLKEKCPMEGPLFLSLSKKRDEVYQKAFSFFKLCEVHG